MKILGLLTVFIGLGICTVQGQIIVEINSTFGGMHTTSSAAPGDAVPYNYNDKSVHLQLLYPATDLNMGGAGTGFTIDSIGWWVVDQIGGNLQNYTIKMKNTSNTNTAVYDGVGLTVVRAASPLVPAIDTAWYMIPLTNHFFWDGTSNLLIDVCWGVNPSSSATGRVRHYSYGASTERILLKSSSSNTCSGPTTQTAAYRPYLRLTGVCVDTSVTKNGNVLVATQPAATYQWIDCSTNQAITGATNTFYLPTASGSYAVVVTKGVCSDTSGCHGVSLTGLQDNPNNIAATISPNPASDQVMIKANDGEYLVSVLALNGKLLSQVNMHLLQNEGSLLNVRPYKGQLIVVKIENQRTHDVLKRIISVIE